MSKISYMIYRNIIGYRENGCGIMICNDSIANYYVILYMMYDI